MHAGHRTTVFDVGTTSVIRNSLNTSITANISTHTDIYIALLEDDRGCMPEEITSVCFPVSVYRFKQGHDKMRLSCAAAVSGLSAPRSTFAVQQQRKLCCRYVNMSMARQGSQTTKRTVQIGLVFRPATGVSRLRCTLVCDDF